MNFLLGGSGVSGGGVVVAQMADTTLHRTPVAPNILKPGSSERNWKSLQVQDAFKGKLFAGGSVNRSIKSAKAQSANETNSGQAHITKGNKERRRDGWHGLKWVCSSRVDVRPGQEPEHLQQQQHLSTTCISQSQQWQLNVCNHIDEISPTNFKGFSGRFCFLSKFSKTRNI